MDIVAGERRCAVVMGAKYPLVAAGPDRLRNTTGQLDLLPQFGLAVITAGACNAQTPSNALMASAVLPGLLTHAGQW